MGDKEADYDDDGQVDYHHQGLRTTSAAVTLMKDLFPQSKKILIAGCSAGGYGTLLARDPQLKVGMFSSCQDGVSGRAFLGMKPTTFRDLLVNARDKIHAGFPDTFKRYFIKGAAHCVADYFYSVDGVSVRDWI